MTHVDIIVIVLLALVVGGAIFYIVREKKKGNKCIGCPYSASCGKAKGDSKDCCSSHNDEKQV